jgi:hypothetical protein
MKSQILTGRSPDDRSPLTLVSRTRKSLSAFFSANWATAQLGVREFLSWEISRQSLINQLLGRVTYSVGPAQSALFAQGANGYPGATGLGPTANRRQPPRRRP